MNEIAPLTPGEIPSQPVTPQPVAGLGAAPAPLRGDLTHGPILPTLLAFSVPTLISNLLQTLNGSINAVWVGRLIGESALAATANANLIMFLLIAAAFGFGMATAVRIGQAFGARDIDAARLRFGTGVGFCTALSGVAAIAGWVFAPALLALLNTPAASLAEALAYLRVTFVSLPFATVSMLLATGLRGAGDSRVPLQAMILTVVLDVAFNPLLIRGVGPLPAFGIAGSAASTALANFAGVLWMIAALYRRDLPLRLRGRELGYLWPDRGELAFLVAKGLPMGAQVLIVSSAGLVMIGLVNREGLDTVAAYGASLQLWNYLQMPALAISSAVSAMVAQNLGAGQERRIVRITHIGIVMNVGLAALLAIAIVVFDRPLLALFLGGDSPSLPIAERIQVICTGSFVLIAATVVLIGTMRAYGVVGMPLLSMAAAFYPARLGFYAVAYPHIGARAIWWAYPVGAAASLVFLVPYYLRGRWRDDAIAGSLGVDPLTGAPAAARAAGRSDDLS